MKPPRDTDRVVQVRLTGSHADVFAVLTALGIAHPGGWNLDLHTTKTRNNGQIQAYARFIKTAGEPR